MLLEHTLLHHNEPLSYFPASAEITAKKLKEKIMLVNVTDMNETELQCGK